MKRERRKIKLINPALQLRIVGAFAGASMLSFLLQGLFIASRLSQQRVADAAGAGRSPNVWVEVTVLALGLFLPLMIAFGILLTHRIAGPVYRIEQHLRAFLRGEETGPCVLRKGDEMGELCDLVNQALEHAVDRGRTGSESPEELRKTFRAVS